MKIKVPILIVLLLFLIVLSVNTVAIPNEPEIATEKTYSTDTICNIHGHEKTCTKTLWGDEL